MNKKLYYIQDRGKKKFMEKAKYFITADEHYFHHNMLKYANRPFKSIEEMNETLISNHNEVVSCDDITIHAGDFTLKDKKHAEKIIKRLNGNHIFLKGSHDRWLKKNTNMIWEGTIDKQFIVICHYCLRTWARSHYNSWHFFAHSHGKLEPIGKSWDVGVDNNNFYPFSFVDQIKEIMKKRPDNPNLIRR